jgi:hypothetical protein
VVLDAKTEGGDGALMRNWCGISGLACSVEFTFQLSTPDWAGSLWGNFDFGLDFQLGAAACSLRRCIGVTANYS